MPTSKRRLNKHLWLGWAKPEIQLNFKGKKMMNRKSIKNAINAINKQATLVVFECMKINHPTFESSQDVLNKVEVLYDHTCHLDLRANKSSSENEIYNFDGQVRMLFNPSHSAVIPYTLLGIGVFTGEYHHGEGDIFMGSDETEFFLLDSPKKSPTSGDMKYMGENAIQVFVDLIKEKHIYKEIEAILSTNNNTSTSPASPSSQLL